MAYKIYGTNEPYSGMVVGPIGGYFYTTRGEIFYPYQQQYTPFCEKIEAGLTTSKRLGLNEIVFSNPIPVLYRDAFPLKKKNGLGNK